MSVNGRVFSKKVVILEQELPEGTAVSVSVLDEQGFELTADAEEELLESMAEGDRGETVSLEEVMKSLKRP